MTDHVALVPDRARRNLRTILNVALSVAVVILGLVPVILQAVEPLQEHLPGSWYLWLVGVAGTVVAVAGAVQRILTSSVVEQLLQNRAPALAATSADAVAQITTLPALPTLAVLTEADRAALVELRAALADDRAPATDPAVTALEHVLT